MESPGNSNDSNEKKSKKPILVSNEKNRDPFDLQHVQIVLILK